MKRRNVQQAFVGEADPGMDIGRGPEALVEGDEAVDIEVRGGRVMVVVPATTPDEELFDRQRFVGGELELEDGSILSFTIEDGAVGARATRSRQRASRQAGGLSSLPNIPGAV